MKRIKRTYQEKEEVLRKSNRKCAHCGVEIDEKSMTIDHFYPLYKGGEDELVNIVALCEPCNKKKANFIYEPADFYTFLNSDIINELDEYLEDKYYKKGYPLGDITKIIHVADKITHNAAKSASSTEEMLFIRNKFMMKLILEKAYPADSEELLKFIIKSKNYLRKLNTGKNYHKYEIEDKWLAKRVIEDCILRDKVYTLSSLATKEYYGYFFFNKIKDLHIVDDIDNIYKNVKDNFFISAYNVYKFPQVAPAIFKMIGEYCKKNETFIPILEMASPSDYTALTQMDTYIKDKYSFVKVEFRNVSDPIPEEKHDSPLYGYYNELVYFFRVPKFYLYGQPMTELIYLDIIKEIKKCERSVTR